jgi:hypothetical protein
MDPVKHNPFDNDLKDLLNQAGLTAGFDSALALLNPQIVPNCVAACSCCCQPGSV